MTLYKFGSNLDDFFVCLYAFVHYSQLGAHFYNKLNSGGTVETTTERLRLYQFTFMD